MARTPRKIFGVRLLSARQSGEGRPAQRRQSACLGRTTRSRQRPLEPIGLCGHKQRTHQGDQRSDTKRCQQGRACDRNLHLPQGYDRRRPITRHCAILPSGRVAHEMNRSPLRQVPSGGRPDHRDGRREGVRVADAPPPRLSSLSELRESVRLRPGKALVGVPQRLPDCLVRDDSPMGGAAPPPESCRRP